MVDSLNNALNYIWQILPKEKGKELSVNVVDKVTDMLPQRGRVFVRLAGLSGLAAVALGAYGSHVFRSKEVDPELKYVFEMGNKYHYIHTLALLAVPMTGRPVLVGSLLITGMAMFSGSCYYHGLTGSSALRKITPYGGTILMAGWLAMVL